MASGGKTKLTPGVKHRKETIVKAITENLLWCDKLGRHLNIGQYFVWFTDGKTGPVSHLGYIFRYTKGVGFYGHPVKSKQYVQNWEKVLDTVGWNTDNLVMTDSIIDMNRMLGTYGIYILETVAPRHPEILYPHIWN